MTNYEGKDEGLDVSFDYCEVVETSLSAEDVAMLHYKSEEACVQVYNDYTESEMLKQPVSTQECWYVGERVVRAREEVDKIFTKWYGDFSNKEKCNHPG